MQRTEVVRFTTEDGLELPGLYYRPMQRNQMVHVDAILLVHGSAGSLVNPFVTDLALQFVQRGMTTLSFSNRGREIAWAPLGSKRLFGNAYEDLREASLDLDSAVRWLAQSGAERIAIVGHSLGGLKAMMYVASQSRQHVATVVAISPPRLSAHYYEASPWAESFAEAVRRVEEASRHQGEEALVKVEFPLGTTWMSARTYAQKYFGEQFDITHLAPKLTVPLLFTTGELEAGPTKTDVPEDMKRAPAGEHVRKVITIRGADHLYRGCRADLVEKIMAWLQEDWTKSPVNENE